MLIRIMFAFLLLPSLMSGAVCDSTSIKELVSRGDSLLSLGAFKESLIPLTQAEIGFAELHCDPKRFEHLVDVKLAIVFALFNHEEYRQAEAYLLEAQRITLEQLGDTSKYMCSILNNLGALFELKNDYEEAINHTKRAIECRISLDDTKNFSTALFNLAGLQASAGNRVAAEFNYRTALEVVYNKNLPSALQLSPLHRRMASNYEALNQDSLAFYHYKKAISTVILDRSKKDRLNFERAYSSLAYFYLQRDQPNIALANIQEAQRTLEQFNYEYIDLQKLQGRALRNLGRLQDSKDVLNQAVHSIRSRKKKSQLPVTLLDLSKTHMQLGNLDSARINAEEALLLKNFKSKWKSPRPTLVELNPNIALMKYLEHLGNIYLMQYSQEKKTQDLNDAEYYYLLADSAVAALQTEHTSEGSMLAFSKRRRITSEGLTRVQLERLMLTQNDRAELAKALAVCEKSKSAVLDVLISRQERLLKDGVPPELIRKFRKIEIERQFTKQQILKLERKGRPSDSLKIDRLIEQGFNIQTEYDSTKQSIAVFSKALQVRPQSPKIDLDHLQQRLSDNQAIIEYLEGDTCLYTFLITKRFIELTTVSLTGEYKAGILALTSRMDSGITSQNTGEEGDLDTIASKLSEFLLASPMRKLAPNIDQLIIIPDGLNSVVPFEILPIEFGTDKQKRKTCIEEFEICYQRSLLSFLNASKQGSLETLGKNYPYYGCAPNYPEKQDLIALQSEPNRSVLADLPSAVSAVEEISKLLNGQALLGDLSTKSRFMSTAHQGQILHLAMHGLIDNENPRYSKLIFRGDTSTYDELYAYEIARMDLDAELAVLSACNTGSGKIKKGEGVLSLARAFTMAGVPSTVMSLWSVPSQATSDIMVSFHKYLLEGMTKSAALRQAKLDYIENAPPSRQHPFYWAGFVAVGDMRPLVQKNTIPAKCFILGGSLLLLLTAGFYWKKQTERIDKQALRSNQPKK